MRLQRLTNWMGLSSPAAGRPINYDATRKFSSLCVIWISKISLLPLSAMAVGRPSQQALCRGAKLLVQLASRTTSLLRVVSGSMKQRPAREIWYGAELSKIFQISVGNWLLHSLNERKSLVKI